MTTYEQAEARETLRSIIHAALRGAEWITPPSVDRAVADAILSSPWLAGRDARNRAEAWDEGFKQGGPMHTEFYGEPDRHKVNPYRKDGTR